MDNTVNDIGYYKDVIKRRKFYFIIPFIIVFAAGVAVASTLPSIYRSKATILVEAQNIPEDLVKTTVTGYIEDRMHGLRQIVFSRQNLEDIIHRIDLYSETRENNTIEQAVSRMRRDIQLEQVHAQLAGRRTGPTVAFNLSFEGYDPQKTADAVNALASLFLEHNLREREEKAAGAVNFFRQQLEELRREIDLKEYQIARFKEENLHTLPETSQFNMQMLERTRNEIENRKQNINSLQNRLAYFQSQLAMIEPIRYRGERGSLEEELRILNTEYLALKAIRTDNHPDLRRLRNQIESLSQETGFRQSLRGLAIDLDNRRNQLALLRKRYSENHPDVISMTREIEALEAQLNELSSQRSLLMDVEKLDPENPAYINIQSQISTTKMEIDNEMSKIQSLERDFAQYQQRIENAPNVEQRYKTLQREYAGAQQAFNEIRSRLQTALQARELEEEQMAEKLTLIDPARASETPVKPNRKAIMMLGLILGCSLGIGVTALSEYFDSSVRNSYNLANVSGNPVLGNIPYLKNRRDRSRTLFKRLSVFIGIVSIVAIGLLLVHIYHEPLDVLVIKFQGKIGLN